MEWTPDTIMHCDLINYCLVIDTNILLSDLKSITVVIDKYLPGKINSSTNESIVFYCKINFI